MDSISSVMGFNVVFPQVFNGPGDEILADLILMQHAPENTEHDASAAPIVEQPCTPSASGKVLEIGGPSGLEPTRFGDWERKGRCIDF
jgi:hypothetical protein